MEATQIRVTFARLEEERFGRPPRGGPMGAWRICAPNVPAVGYAADLLRVLMGGGLDYRRFAYGGADWHKSYVLDEHDRLIELEESES